MAAVAHMSKGRVKGPEVNLFDVPELMRGAQPSANPAQREEFEQRCQKLHRDLVAEEEQTRVESGLEASSTSNTETDLGAMFPMLDAALVRMLAAEAPTPQRAIETLLALAAATAEPVVSVPSPPARNLGVEDMASFPSLCDSDGWQVVSKQQLERDPNEELGSAWRDRTKAAAGIPAPRAAQRAPHVAHAGSRRRAPREKDEEHACDQPQWETDYEFRQRIGQKRAWNRTQFGRGRGGGREAGSQADCEAGSSVDDAGSGTEADQSRV
mmetsp:Transcript_138583/g.244840  ORF Transcript_138583/g.244840 Transcript_138583/m.244840 type:complete len:269 (+) Transcript_138583:111-917(+)